MCDKSRNTSLCVHWQWNTLEWCQLNALQASPVVHLVTPLSCVSLSMNTQPSVPAIETWSEFIAIQQNTQMNATHCWTESHKYCLSYRLRRHIYLSPDSDRIRIVHIATPQWLLSHRLHTAGLILGLRPANERRRYKVTPSLIGWPQN